MLAIQKLADGQANTVLIAENLFCGKDGEVWMIEINDFLFFGLIIGTLLIGMTFGLMLTRDYRKSLEKEYKEKRMEIYNTIRKETKEEWSKGWDAAYRSYRERQKAYYLWFREHGYETKDIVEWLEKYMEGR